MTCQNNKDTLRCVSFTILVIQCYLASCTVTSINTYINNKDAHKRPEIEKISHSISAPGDDHKSIKSFSRSDKVGNVIFDDNIAFSPSSAQTSVDKGKNKGKRFSNSIEARGLENHRLEGPLSSEMMSSAAAAAVASSPGFNFHSSGNDLKIAGDNSHHSTATHQSNNVVRGAGVVEVGGQGQSRSFFPNGFHGQNGWASNTGSCLFSCSSNSRSFGQGGSASCCQLNYVQCCPNPQNELWNFKNLHHGRSYYLGGGINKGGYGWGSQPYNPPPIIRPKPSCLPYHQHHHHPPVVVPPIPIGVGGSIIHKGIETIKHNIHNIGHLFKDVGIGWGAGGNGAAGYYFHRRSDNLNNDEWDPYVKEGTYLPKKKRAKRDISHGWTNSGFDNVIPLPGPCTVPVPVNTVHNDYSSRPHSVGLGSLIGWTKPGNQFLGGFKGGYSDSVVISPPDYSTNKGHGWGYSQNHCKSDFECPGYLRCCQGVCQVAPHLHTG